MHSYLATDDNLFEHPTLLVVSVSVSDVAVRWDNERTSSFQPEGLDPFEYRPFPRYNENP